MNDTVTIPDYDRIWAETYGDMQDIGPVHRHMRRIVKKLLSSIEFENFLDVGCGCGHAFDLLSNRGEIKKFAGLDISHRALEMAREKYGNHFYHMDCQRDRLESTWDLVHCSLLLEHLPNDTAVLENLRAMTKHYLLITTISGNYERYQKWEVQMGHVRNYNVGELEMKLEKAGFTLKKVIYWGFPFFSPCARLVQNMYRSKNTFTLLSRIIAHVLYILFFLNSSKRGDLLIILAKTDNYYRKEE